MISAATDKDKLCRYSRIGMARFHELYIYARCLQSAAASCLCIYLHIKMASTAYKQYDVVVVGAGLSGLQAAHLVRAAGFSVCVVEAINRVGGKTLTVQSCEKGFNDLGASWINDTNQSEMFKLYKRYGIDIEVQRDSGETLIQSADGSVTKVPFGELPVSLGSLVNFHECWLKNMQGNLDVLVKLLDVFRTECSILDLDNPTNSARAREIDQLTFREFCIQEVGSEDAFEIANLLSACLLGVESQEVSALYMLLYFKSGAGIDNIISDQKDGGQYLRNRQGKTYLMIMITDMSTNKTRKPNTLPEDGRGALSKLRLSPYAGHFY